MTDQPALVFPACYTVSFFAPGEGACSASCRLASACQVGYLANARVALARQPSALSDDERAYVDDQFPESASSSRLHLRAVKDEPAPVAGEQSASTRGRPGAPPRPLGTFRHASVAALAVEVLQAAGRWMHVRDLTAEVLRLAPERGVRLGGRTPEATVGSALRQVQGVELLGRGDYRWRGAAGAEPPSR